MIWIQGILMLIFSIGSDWFAVKWHEARENKDPLMGVIWAIILAAIGWLSFIWVMTSSLWLAVPDLIGTAIGSYYGIKYHHAPLPLAAALGFYKKQEIEENKNGNKH